MACQLYICALYELCNSASLAWCSGIDLGREKIYNQLKGEMKSCTVECKFLVTLAAKKTFHSLSQLLEELRDFFLTLIKEKE